MDGASTALGIAKSVYDGYSTVKTMHKEFKEAPERLQLLEDDRELIIRLLDELSTSIHGDTSGSLFDVEQLERLQQSVERGSNGLQQVLAKVVKQDLVGEDNLKARRSVRLLKFLLHRDDIKDSSNDLKELRESLALRWQLDNAMRVAMSVEDIQSTLQDMSYRLTNLPSSLTCLTMNAQKSITFNASSTEPNEGQYLTGLIRSRTCGPCQSDCQCRCHARVMQPLLPTSLARYIGQFFVSRQLLAPAFTPWSCCNVATCRGTYLNAAKISWVLPRSILHGQLQASPNRRIHFSINAPRVVPFSSPIFRAVACGDIEGVRGLFARQQASIWDVNIQGDSILLEACAQWQSYPSETRLEIIRFLAEAGADTALYARTESRFSAFNLLALGLLQYLLDTPTTGSSYTAAIQTTPVAIDVLRSLFNIDATDALEDLFSHCYGHSDEDVSHLLTLLETAEYTTARCSAFNAIQYTPLTYAIAFSPSSVESLLAEGVDVTEEPALGWAVSAGRSVLIKPLIDQGADVNMRDGNGQTALHVACYQCYLKGFVELVRWAEDEIDWNARTPEGHNALELFEMGVSGGYASYLTSEEVDWFRSVIASHTDPSQLHAEDDSELNVPNLPGAFPTDT